MSKWIDAILKADGVVLEVTTKSLYVFHPRPDNRTAKQIVQEFFRDYDINLGHASRNASEVGNSKVVTKIRILKKGDDCTLDKLEKQRKLRKGMLAPQLNTGAHHG